MWDCWAIVRVGKSRLLVSSNQESAGCLYNASTLRAR